MQWYNGSLKKKIWGVNYHSLGKELEENPEAKIFF